MSEDFIASLGWLRPPPKDFRSQLKNLNPANAASVVRSLAATALDNNQLHALAKRMRLQRDAGTDLNSFTDITLGVISASTTDLFLPAIEGTGPRFGLAVTAVAAPFGQMVQVCAGMTPAFTEQTPDAVLLVLDARYLPPDAGTALEQVRQMRAGVRKLWGVPCIVQNLVPFPEALYGSHDVMIAGSNLKFCADFNTALANDLLDSLDVLFNVASLAANVGNARWHDPVIFNQAKLAFSQDLVPLYTDHICRLLAALRGKNRRCLVLDLDNTLWGGVIGDDGLEGIVLGQGDADGEAFIEIQKAALGLRERGIVLAVCSKNDDAIARQPFREHPEMLLHEEHIAVFQANWQDKASNIKAIADTLNLGLESLVLLDDNPVERDLVRSYLPEVAVPELPEEPGLYVRTLLSAGYFESLHMSAEDRTRVTDYQANAQRAEVLEQAVDLDSYLETLNMQAELRPFDELGLKRIVQLINKSNQFNLTTLRYTEPEVQQLITDDRYRTWQVRLQDCFSDNGMICTVICERDDDAWKIDTWLMSCRVLGRRVEELVLRELVNAAKADGASTLQGTYIATDRNGLVKHHYEKLGFTQTEGDEKLSQWELRLNSYAEPELPFAAVSKDQVS
jgi:FkbH-like protein